ncbi:SGNH/GDSL hydrolase family protein [Pseudorhodoferax sp.]|uniref:SGNH/GDSL hydrolase family protein n=1 Tax=Pseudorhodoferax sp. TaxID=1993553 RepID=UPI002DD6A3A2|nr:SGNH/GDSL hydrolase family protein [Pseudorhodoferax sp.]
MSRISWRRTVAAMALCASAALLAACGSSSTESALTPERLISFGDAFSDVGQANGVKYTVNDTATNHWLQQLASRYGRTITASASGGQGYARSNARIKEKPDAIGNADTPTLTEQIDAFLAGGGAFAGNDLVIINGGLADVLTEGKAFLAGTQTDADMVAHAQQAGRDLAEQARRLITAGAKQLVVVGTINLGATPWGQNSGQVGALRNASLRFNEAFLVAVNDLGANLLYVDAAYYFNLAAEEPGNFSMRNSRDVVCTSVDPGPGIGLGAGEVNSALCTPSTVLAGVNYNEYMFADKLYTTPNLQRLFGDYAYDRIRNRW